MIYKDIDDKIASLNALEEVLEPASGARTSPPDHHARMMMVARITDLLCRMVIAHEECWMVVGEMMKGKSETKH